MASDSFVTSIWVSKHPSRTVLDWLRRSWANELGYAIGLFLALRCTLSLFALLFSSFMPLDPPCSSDPALTEPSGTGMIANMLGVWRQWDTCLYEQVATNGYQPESDLVAFFPLYPLLLRATTFLAGSLPLAELILSGPLFVAAVVGVHRLLASDFGAATARRAIFYLAIFPSGFYLVLAYTESLFLALVAWSLYAARRGAWGWSILAACMASLTRTQGCLLILPLAWEVYRQRSQFTARGEWLWRAVLVTLPPLGATVAFLIYCQVTTGWTSFQAQSAWGVTYQIPWSLLQQSLQFITRTSSIIEMVNLGMLLLFVALFFVGLRRLPGAYTLYVAPQLFLLMFRQVGYMPLASATRYLLVLFPLFALLALLIPNRQRHGLWITISLTLTVVFLYHYLFGTFVA